MKTRLTRKPGQKGTKKLTALYGEKLVCVRYRYDIVISPIYGDFRMFSCQFHTYGATSRVILGFEYRWK